MIKTEHLSDSVTLHLGDCRDVLRTLPSESVHTVITSPPYWGLRDYGVDGQLGLEPTPEAYVTEMVAVFRDVRRVLRNDGTLWLVIGDSYAGCGVINGARPDKNGGVSNRNGLGAVVGLRPKNLVGIPWRVAFALQDDGWWLRQDIIWSKPNPMPESVTDRCTKSHEYLFLLTKSARYYFDAEAISESATARRQQRLTLPTDHPKAAAYGGTNFVDGGISGTRNRRSVWEIATAPFSEAHFAVFPPALVEPCIKAGCPLGGTVLDPFGGAGTVGLAADRLQRNSILIELNPDYVAMAERRIRGDAPLFFAEAVQ